MANDEMYTPKWIFDEINTTFHLDVCAPHNGSLHTPAIKWFCICCKDGLQEKWDGLVWMNPPFSKPSIWVEKFIDHNNGIALLPLSGNSRWWRNLWNTDAEVVMVKPNTGFINTDGEERKIMYGISLWALGMGKGHLQSFSKVR